MLVFRARAPSDDPYGVNFEASRFVRKRCVRDEGKKIRVGGAKWCWVTQLIEGASLPLISSIAKNYSIVGSPENCQEKAIQK